mmetsp:Transcript_2687/g.5088  ORF Transcript_2687/g.5088 Transcript_2687/m.5088 type:complete len:237 (+) Transcript_2687:76-786(+)|eukprot:CAMPEP_0202696762 /NCGR_PEP_ID=MMETSP1385-20130828/10082_1 /ASSEMBLY_ACC=CAM_ASM_000861 /TAXON_ID=933848 /ORGANISM="Elphidium margaritaceum" /LENGTH=236 /DNA_ID=CAMNT_0049353029 /DNA_START=66 /DNA_END=776 /DNA_ORIENTATION=-
MSEAAKEIERFLLLLKSQKGKAAAALLEQILGTRSIFSFGEFLNHENVKALQGSSESKWYDALELFAYGTYTDYKQKQNKYPKFNAKQMSKLKQLSIVTLAGQSTTKILRYNELQKTLDVQTVRELEDLIIDCIYSGLIHGRLDQRKALLEIRFCRGRDINEKSIGLMKNRLLSWLKNTDALIAQIEKQQEQATYLTNKREQSYIGAQINIEALTKDLLEKAQVEQAAKGGGGPHD